MTLSARTEEAAVAIPKVAIIKVHHTAIIVAAVTTLASTPCYLQATLPDAPPTDTGSTGDTTHHTSPRGSFHQYPHKDLLHPSLSVITHQEAF